MSAQQRDESHGKRRDCATGAEEGATCATRWRTCGQSFVEVWRRYHLASASAKKNLKKINKIRNDINGKQLCACRSVRRRCGFISARLIPAGYFSWRPNHFYDTLNGGALFEMGRPFFTELTLDADATALVILSVNRRLGKCLTKIQKKNSKRKIERLLFGCVKRGKRKVACRIEPSQIVRTLVTCALRDVYYSNGARCLIGRPSCRCILNNDWAIYKRMRQEFRSSPAARPPAVHIYIYTYIHIYMYIYICVYLLLVNKFGRASECCWLGAVTGQTRMNDLLAS